jgi:hypothetical protein
MSDLLKQAVAVHGGLERWNAFSRLTARVRIGGALWTLKQQETLLADINVGIETRTERLVIALFGGADQRSVFRPDLLKIETTERSNPESAFAGHTQETPWDPLHVAYFASLALWTYLTLPFHGEPTNPVLLLTAHELTMDHFLSVRAGGRQASR